MNKLLLLFSLLGMVLTATSQDLSTDQLLYYPFDGNAANAASPGTHDGTVVGASLVDGFDGTANSAYQFDGINDQMFFGDIDLTDESFTISFWLKMPEVALKSVSYRILAQRATCQVGNFFDIAFSHGVKGYTVGFEMYGGSSNIKGHVNSGYIDNPNEWKHITIVKDNDNDNSRIYVNGQLASTGAWTTTSNLSVNNTAQLGISNSPCINGSNVKHFVGTLDELRMHKRVLTDAEIQSMVSFAMESTFPASGAIKASASSAAVVDFTDVIDAASVTTSNITVSGSVSGSLTPVLNTDGDKVFIDVDGGFPFGEEITVSLSGIQSSTSTADDVQFSFTTATKEESLIVRYEFDGNTEDSTANAYDLTPNGTFTYVKDRLRKEESAISFVNGNRATMVSNDDMNVGYYKDFSFAFWMKASQGTSERGILDNLSTGRFTVKLSSSGQIWLRMASGETEEVKTTERYDDNQWHHVAITADRDTEYKIYVDGALVATEAKTNFVNLANLSTWSFNSQSEGNVFYNGVLDDFRFYNRVLTQSEVKEIAPIYMFTSPMEGEVAAMVNTDIEFEFGQDISAATAIAGNFTITGSKSGAVTFAITGGDSRVITLDPDTDFDLDEVVTVTYDNLETSSGEILSGTLTFETADADKGMEVYYTFDGDAQNQAGDEFHGQISGANLTNGYDGVANSAYQFDGSSEISIGQMKLDQESFAIAFWMKRDASTSRGEILGQRQFCTYSNFLELSSTYNPNYGKYEVVIIAYKTEGGNKSYAARAEITPGEWTHIVAERDAASGVLRIYKNGELAQESSYPSQYSILNNATMTLGNGNACIGVDGRGRYRGALDDFRFYSRSLDPREVAKLSDFKVEGTFPVNNATKVSATSSFMIDFNELIDESQFTSANVDVTTAGTGSLDYTVVLKGDTLSLVPDTRWPEGETITVAISDIPAATGETLSHSYSFTVATEEESKIIDLSFDGDMNDRSLSEFTFAPSADIKYVADRENKAEKAADFHGAANYINLNAASYMIPELHFGSESDFTIMTWFKTTGNGKQQTFFNRQAGTSRMHGHMKSDGRLSLRMAINDGALVEEVVTEGSYADNTWHHVAFVADRDGMLKLIVDGYEEAAVASQGYNINILSTFRIGAIENNTQNFNGVMDDFKAYNKALTPAQVRSIAPAYVGSYPAEGYNAVALDQEFTLDFLWAADPATAIPANFTLEGASSGAKTVTVSGGDTRVLTISGDSDFNNDEVITLAFSNLLDTMGNSIPDRTFTYEATGINKGMFVYYPIAGNADNEAGDQYHGVINGATLVADRNGNADEAYSFDGNDFITVGDLPISTQSFSVSFWMKRDDVQQQQALMGYRGTCNASNQVNVTTTWSSNLNSYVVGMNTGNTSLGQGFLNYSAYTPISADTWHHISLVRDNEAGLLKVYLDGNLEAVTAFNTSIDVDNSGIWGIASGSACINVDATRRYTGDLDEVRIYNRAITEAEAAALPNLVIAPPKIAYELVEVIIDEDQGPTVIAKVDTLFSSTDNMNFSATSVDHSKVDVYLDGLNLVVNPAADFNGIVGMTLSAFNGRTTSQDFTVNVSAVNDAPVVTAGADLDLPEDFSGVEQIAFTYSQPENEASETVTYSISPEPTAVDFAEIGFNASTGIIIVSALEDGFGAQTFTVTADDGQTQGSAQATITVNPINDAPVFTLQSDDVTITKNFTGTETIDILNESPENETETITYTLSPASVSFVNISVNSASGVIELTAVQDQFGSQEFTLTADDGQVTNNSYSQTFTVAIVENNPPAIVTTVSDITTDEDNDGVVADGITSLFSDDDGDALTFSISADTSAVTVGIKDDRAFYELSENYHGTAIITLMASDGAAETSQTIQLIVNPINDAPVVVVATADQSATEDAVFSFQFDKSTFDDVDGDELTISNVTFTDQAGANTDWLDISETGLINGTPLQAHVGTTTVIVTVSDGELTASDEFIITVQNVNDAPIVANTPSVDMQEDQAAVTVDLNTVFTDEDGDALTFSLTVLGKRELIGVEKTIVSTNITGNTLTITPIANANGNTSVSVTASDGTEQVSYVIPVSIAAVNDAPAVIDQPTMTLQEDQASATLDVSQIFEDVDGDALTYTLGDVNTTIFSVSLTESTLNVTPEPDMNGSYNLLIRASDGTVVTDYALAVEVTSVNDLPTVISQPTLSFEEDGAAETVDLTIIFADVDGEVLTYTFGGGKSGESSVVDASIDGNTLTVTPVADAFGTQNIIIDAADQEGAASYTMAITVSSINDAPEFTISTDAITMRKDETTAQTIEITAGTVPANEADQMVTYIITPDNGSLVTFNLNGSAIEITAVSGAVGEQTFTIEANDGGTENATYSQTFTVTINEILSTNQHSVKIYPNPAVEFLMVEGRLDSPVKLFDINGRSIKTGEINEKIDISDLRNGTYFLQFVDQNGSLKTEKIVVSH